MVKDISELISEIKEFKKNLKGNIKKKTGIVISPKKSISRLAMDGIASFPVLVDDALSADEGMMIARGLEKRFASFLMIVMSMHSRFDMSERDVDMVDYVKQFHQNMDTDHDIIGGSYISTESVSTGKLLNVAESLGVEYEIFATEAINILHTVYEKVNSNFVNAEANKLNFTIEDVTESSYVNNVGKTVFEAKDNSQPIVNTEFKKANDAVPTLLHIRVQPTGTDQKETIDFVIGVQATLHPIKQSDMILNLVKGLKNENKFFNFIRWTTGETKFFKDFLFGIDQMKLEAVTSNSSNALFNMARRRKELSTIKNRFSKDALMPNMSVVVSTDCLARIKEDYGYDITSGAGASQISLIRKLMNEYFMLSFVVVDQGLQRVNIMVDGNSKFDVYTYAGLQREGNSNDRQFKEMMKMLGRSV